MGLREGGAKGGAGWPSALQIRRGAPGWTAGERPAAHVWPSATGEPKGLGVSVRDVVVDALTAAVPCCRAAVKADRSSVQQRRDGSGDRTSTCDCDLSCVGI